MLHTTDEQGTEARATQIEMILRQVDNLPTLAPVAMRLMRIGNIEDADLDQIVELIEADPPLTARLLGLCRRADKGLGDRITTVRRAVIMLGLETVQAAALSVAVFDAMQTCSSRIDEQIAEGAGAQSGGATEHIFDRVGFWKHCIAVATASERIAESHISYGVRPEEAFIAGLLHDLGKLVLHVILPRSYGRLLGIAERRHCSSAEIEQQIFGMDHHIAGRRVAEHWGLPAALRDVIWLRGHISDGLPDVPHRNLINVVTVARAMCRHLHLGWCGDYNHPEPLEGPRGLYARSKGLDAQKVQMCATGLHDAILVRCRAMGLGEESTPQLLLQSLGSANRRLGRLSADLRARTAATQCQTAALEAISILHDSGHMQRGLLETLAAIVLSANKAFGAGFYATVHQMRPGQTWHLSTFSSDGRPLQSHPIDTPHDRETGRCRSLAELGRAPATLNAMGALPWLADHLLEARDVGAVQVLALTSAAARSGGPAAVLLHDAAANADEQGLKALIASWSAAFAAAAHHESARRFADHLASANRALAEAETRCAEMQSMARMGEMAAGAAHEMNNPLAVISGRAEMLSENASSAADRKMARAIVEASGRLSDLITAMSTIANPPAPVPTSVQVREVVSEAVRRAHGMIGVMTEVKTESDDAEASTVIDRELIAGALSELIANALEAAPNGNILVRTQIARTDGRLIVSVTDDGAGMSPHTQQHAFDPFFSDRPSGRRTGLGLTRARRFVELCGGHLRLESSPGSGTTASIEVSSAEPSVAPSPTEKQPIHTQARQAA